MNKIKLKMVCLSRSNSIKEHIDTIINLNLSLFDVGDEIFIREQVKIVPQEKLEYVLTELNDLAKRLDVFEDQLYTLELVA